MLKYRKKKRSVTGGGQWQHGLRLLQEMSEASMQANAMCYVAAISACEKGSQWEMSLEILEQMEQSQLELDELGLQGLHHCATVCL